MMAKCTVYFTQQQVAWRSPSKLLRRSEARGTATSPSRLSAASEDADITTGGRFTVKEEEKGLRAHRDVPGGSIEGDSAQDADTPEPLEISDFLQADVAFDQEEEEVVVEEEEEENWHTADASGFVEDEVVRESGPGGAAKGKGGGGGDGVGSLEGLSADEVEQRLIAAGILRGDGAEIDFEEDDGGGAGVYNEIEVSDGEEACQILEERLGFDEEGIAHLRSKYPPLRGELWYRREPASGGSKTGKKFLDVYFVEETLPDLLDLLLGEEGEGGGVGLDRKQVREMLTTTPSLVGMDVSDAKDVAGYLRSELGLSGKGQLASALAGCPPMLMYHTWDNLRMKYDNNDDGDDDQVSYYRESLAWTNEDVAAMLAEYPNLLSIKMENDVIEVIDYLRTEVGLQPLTVSGMVREFPQVLEVRPKRLKAVVRYFWKVLEIPRSGIAVLLSQHPRTCCLEAEANLAPLRQFFERELFVEASTVNGLVGESSRTYRCRGASFRTGMCQGSVHPPPNGGHPPYSECF
ncbi:conserved unknown protein [Ectocarpus siliculosus]|uniref:Uncharacterized protein n=1 Tax=Ectocarpus siliculosus TaxID=2880 RepID=D7FVI5_ECTSI|nr:conserved unknown protein [Ectocarpus siliculosus]|eukprot:CBJ31906.1 conserved unknown protein [Ectocarpus siliculosus]